MSSDLLHEFGHPENPEGIPENQSVTQDVASDDDDDDDGFGEFEEPDEVEKPNDILANSFQNPGNLIPCPENRKYAKQERFESGNQLQTPVAVKKNHPSIDEDDWGDFAGESVLFDANQASAQGDSHPNHKQGPSGHSRVAKPMKVSLLPVDQQRPSFSAAKPMPKPVDDQYDYAPDEVWEPTDIKQDHIIPENASTLTASSYTAESGTKNISEVKRTVNGPPPSNIPPPSVLLPLVAQYFQSLPTVIKKITPIQHVSSDASGSLKQPQIDQIQAALASARAGARILAGRRLRWKRDTLLSQSMKIGPASGKAGGMKLTGVDKGESRREDQEAAEVLSVWRKQVGPLRSIISMLNGQRLGSGLTLPDISENMPIRVMKPSEGAVSAPKGCFLCGIKRDERVAKVDVAVEDSFGEWWCEHWGHLDCVIFWDNHEGSLPQRR